MSIYDFFPKKNTVEIAPNPPSTAPPVNDAYLLSFREMLSTALSLHPLSPQDREVIDRFHCLSDTAQLLYVRLYHRKGFWYYVEELDYVGDVRNAARELVGMDFAWNAKEALLGPIERMYELLKSLHKPDLFRLISPCQSLLTLFTSNDHTETPCPLFPRPDHNPLYPLYRHFSTANHLKSIFSMSISTVWTQNEPKPKAVLMEYLMEMMGSIKELVNEPKNAYLVKKKGEMKGKSGISWVEMVLNDEFPELIGLKITEKTVFMRLLAAFDYFHSENQLNYMNYLRISASKYPAYPCNPLPTPLFPTNPENESIFEAFLSENMLKTLHEHRLSKEIEGNIAVLMSNMAVNRLISDKNGFISSITDFTEVYSPEIDGISWLIEYSAEWKWTKVAHHCISYLEKAHLWSAVVPLLCNLLVRPCYYQRRGLWWERLIIDLYRHLSDTQNAKIAINFALNDPWVKTGKRISIEKHGIRFGFPSNSPIPCSDPYFSQYKHRNFQVRTISAPHIQGDSGPLYVTETLGTVGVEEYAIWWYSTQGWKGFHCENALFRAVYAVLMWEVLYSDGVPGTFSHKYQKAALDYKSCTFYEARKEAFEREFEYLQGKEDLREVFLERYARYAGCLSVYVDWDVMAGWGVSSLQEILQVLPPACLISIFRILAQDYKYTNHGLPDLLLWNSTSVMLVEVKSHNDRLADHQKLWIQMLTELGLRVEVLHVLNA